MKVESDVLVTLKVRVTVEGDEESSLGKAILAMDFNSPALKVAVARDLQTWAENANNISLFDAIKSLEAAEKD